MSIFIKFVGAKLDSMISSGLILTLGYVIFKRRKFSDPKDTQFEPLLAHFEQLRQMYETSEQDEDNV